MEGSSADATEEGSMASLFSAEEAVDGLLNLALDAVCDSDDRSADANARLDAVAGTSNETSLSVRDGTDADDVVFCGREGFVNELRTPGSDSSTMLTPFGCIDRQSGGEQEYARQIRRRLLCDQREPLLCE